ARADEPELGISAAYAQGHSRGGKGGGERWPGVAARIRGKLLVQRAQCGVAGREGVPPEALEQMPAPLLAVDDPRRKTLGCRLSRRTLTGGSSRCAAAPSTSEQSARLAETRSQCRSTTNAGYGSCALNTRSIASRTGSNSGTSSSRCG